MVFMMIVWMLMLLVLCFLVGGSLLDCLRFLNNIWILRVLYCLFNILVLRKGCFLRGLSLRVWFLSFVSFCGLLLRWILICLSCFLFEILRFVLLMWLESCCWSIENCFLWRSVVIFLVDMLLVSWSGLNCIIVGIMVIIFRFCSVVILICLRYWNWVVSRWVLLKLRCVGSLIVGSLIFLVLSLFFVLRLNRDWVNWW